MTEISRVGKGRKRGEERIASGMKGRRKGERHPVYATGKETVLGRIRIREHFAFVTPEEPLPNGEREIYVPREGTAGAMDGDLVRVSLFPRRRGVGGLVEEVVERAKEIVYGTLDRRGRRWVLCAATPTIPFRVQGMAFGVKESEVRSGMRAALRITKYPEGDEGGEGFLEKIFGPAGDPEVELTMSREVRSVPKEFPEAVLEAASRAGKARTIPGRSRRKDLRGLEVFTIDPVDARDFDDALSLEERSSGWRVGIHIADVASYVKEGDPIDQEAYDRATSVYLPGEVIPMLPESLSNGICSLVEGEDRAVVSVLVEFDPDGNPAGFSHCRSVIRSRRRFTYEEVDEILERGEGEFARELELLKWIAQRLYERRMERGAVDFEMPERKPILGLDGKVLRVQSVARTWSHRLVEELMILANEYVARCLEKAGRGIYRVHETPDARKVFQLRRLAKAFGKRIRGGSLQRIVDAFRGTPAQPVVELMVLRSMMEARYSAENLGHYGLASEAYAHFTSPIRRYPDLVVHRLLFKERCRRDLEETAEHCSRREREAVEAERDALEIKLLEYSRTRLGQQCQGVIDGLNREGIFLILDFGARGFLSLDEFEDGPFTFRRMPPTLLARRSGRRLSIGDPLDVVVAAVDIENRRLVLARPGRKGGRSSGGGRRGVRGEGAGLGGRNAHGKKKGGRGDRTGIEEGARRRGKGETGGGKGKRKSKKGSRKKKRKTIKRRRTRRR
ncbi:MAG: VacB/RNase II family 3'-5' exoribonuclease [Candidatus Hydrogenedentota bacterium]|nr:MAG: VacB/RNase II family 3'-5' exoribonuclease [Candidatus Hydrogenedentota bacterium]